MSYKINNASNHIQWQIIRKNSSFLKRQRGIPKLFSTEKFNTQRINSLRYNGLINKKAVDVQVFFYSLYSRTLALNAFNNNLALL